MEPTIGQWLRDHESRLLVHPDHEQLARDAVSRAPGLVRVVTDPYVPAGTMYLLAPERDLAEIKSDWEGRFRAWPPDRAIPGPSIRITDLTT
jgi:hypothetical protein